ncbi:hypothetical protein C8R42DRAFT_730043 [Lentinula raphanica]|nr:hypothetical protein C8R42DRAFT_730043 [Lentinula raphanica]
MHPVTPRKRAKPLMCIDTNLKKLANSVNTSDTEDDCSGYSPRTPELLERAGVGFSSDGEPRRYTKNASQQDAETTLAPQSLETVADVALHLALKVQKRDNNLNISKKKIQRLKGYLRDGADREAKLMGHLEDGANREAELKAEVRALREQQSNWQRAGEITKAILDSAAKFPPTTGTQ